MFVYLGDPDYRCFSFVTAGLSALLLGCPSATSKLLRGDRAQSVMGVLSPCFLGFFLRWETARSGTAAVAPSLLCTQVSPDPLA